MEALSSVRVLDLSRLLPGPYATMVLADMGARVDKLEDLDGGDYLRHMPPLVDGTSAFFLAINRGKRSLCLDLKRPEGAAALVELVAHYDVLVESFRPGVLDRLGLSHERLLDANPSLVVCALTGFGQTGPLAKRAGHDIGYLARSGVLGVQGPADGPPQLPGFQLADVAGALHAVIAILGALIERQRTGRGRVLDVAMTDSTMGFAMLQLAPALAGNEVSRGNELLTGGLAAYGVYRTSDGKFMALGALEPKFWLAFANATGLGSDVSGIVPGPHQPALRARVAELFASRTRAEWETFAASCDCCLEPVLAPDELRGDPHIVARRAIYEMPARGGTLTQIATPSTNRDASALPPPMQGEHTAEILRDAGFDAARVASLISAGIAR